jgi:aldose 1-epimerase
MAASPVTQIGERTIDGFRALTLRDGDLEAAFVPDAGMVGCSLRHGGDELLGQRDGLRTYATTGTTMGIPLLHPWANRLGRKRFSLLGREIVLERDSPRLSVDPNGLPIHGLLGGARGWLVERHEASDGRAVLVSSFAFAEQSDLIASFPFPHRVVLEATLTMGALTIATMVVPASGSLVPVSFGYHPYLRLPGMDRSKWQVEIPVRERLVLDRLMLPTGAAEPVELEAGPLGSRTFDDGYVAPEGGAPFVLAGGGRRIEVSFGVGYGFAQVYAPADDDVIAYEPMTAPTNALVVGGPDLPVASPDGSYTAVFSIAVADLD